MFGGQSEIILATDFHGWTQPAGIVNSFAVIIRCEFNTEWTECSAACPFSPNHTIPNTISCRA